METTYLDNMLELIATHIKQEGPPNAWISNHRTIINSNIPGSLNIDPTEVALTVEIACRAPALNRTIYIWPNTRFGSPHVECWNRYSDISLDINFGDPDMFTKIINYIKHGLEL